MGEDRTEACRHLVFPMGNLIVVIDLETNLFEEWAVIRHGVLPERQSGDAIRIKLKRYESEASTRTEDPGDLDERGLLVGDVLEGINAHQRIG